MLSVLLMLIALLGGGHPLAPRPHKLPPARPAATTILTVHPGRSVELLSARGGRELSAVGAADAFGAPSVLSVVRRRGDWAAVTDVSAGNGHLGWVRLDSPSLRTSTTRWSILVRRGEHQVTVSYAGTVKATFIAGVGDADSPTPLGEFSVTDKLPGARFSPAYGCCILALSATQPHPPAGWTGGDRMAIHGTDDPASIGRSMSSGCVHLSDADMRWLLARVPSGTPVRIER